MSVTKLPLKKKIALDLFRIYRNNEKKLHKLNYLFWECTLRCNLSCIHCGSDCLKNPAVNDMPREDFFRALDQLTPIVEPNKTMIVLTGGEALMRNDLEIIGAELYQRGFPWGIVTNGYLLSAKRLEALSRAGLRAVTVSLDGFEKEHNWMRGSSKSYQKAFSAIKELVRYENIVFDVVSCANKRNLKDLPDFRDMLIKTGVKKWRIFTVFPIGRAREIDELQLDPKEFKQLFDFIQASRLEANIEVNYGCEGFLGNYEEEVRDNFFYCRAGINIASVLADGSISACPSLRDNFIQGSIYKDNIASVWENKYTLYRDRSWTRTGICAECKFFKYCEGNGLHLRDENTGELLFCHLERLKEAEKK